MNYRGLVVLVLLVLVGGASCARQRVALPPAVAEDQECQFSRLQAELALLEKELQEDNGERANHLIRAARLAFLLGELGPRQDKQGYFAKGRRLAEMLCREQPAWADGHYWLALNLCGLAEVGGPRQGLKMIPEITEALEQALRVNPTYDQAGPHRVLGRIYYECPPWPLSVGDIHASFRHLTAAATLAPENSTNHLYLAETLLRLGKTEEARLELEKVLRAKSHALCPKFLEEDRLTARQLLSKK